MKKLACLLLALCLLLGLSACLGNPLPPMLSENPGTTAAPAPETTREKPVITTAAPVETQPVTTEAPTEAPTTEAPTEPAFVPGGSVEIETDAVPSGWTVKELGAVGSGDGTLTLRSDGTAVRYEMDADNNVLYIPVNYMGEQISDERYAYFDKLLPGLYTVTSFEDTVNCNGLMSETGELLIPCECGMIKTITPDNTENADIRFLLVVYATDETKNQDEAFFYTSDALISIHPEEGDKLYKGYAKIYDIENQRFIPDLTITNPNKYDTSVGGGLVYTKTTDGERIVYNADGKMLYKSSEYTSVNLGDGFYVINKEVYDTEGNLLFEGEGYGSFMIIKGSARFLEQYDSKTSLYTVYDYYGNKLFEVPDGMSVYGEAKGLFRLYGDKTNTLVNAQGEEVYSNNDSLGSYEGYGMWEFSPSGSDSNTVYYLVNGTEVTSSEHYVYKLINEVKESSSGVFSFYPWNKPTEKVTVKCSYAEKLTDGLICAKGSTYALVDCFSGETILTADNIGFGDFNYIYATVNGHTKVYELVLE